MMGKTVEEPQKEIHQNAIEHGWWNEERAFGTLIALYMPFGVIRSARRS